MGILMRIILGLSVTAALVAVPSTPAQSGFAPITLSTNGERPSIAVDEEGTAHVAWNERATNGADVLHYCRVPRGATACEGEQRLVPPDGEARFNTDTAGPRVVLTGPQDVALLTFRYPNVVTVNRQGSPDPDCYEKFPLPSEECYGSSSKTWIYRSTDGGATFGPPRIFSHRAPSGDAVVLNDSFELPAPGIEGQSGTGPLIATVTETESGGTYFASAPPDGYARTTANLGDEGPDRAYGGTVAPLDDATPVAAFNDLSSNLYIRQWRGAGPRNDIANWAPAQRVDAGEEPHLAGGPGGVFLLYRPRAGSSSDQFVVRRWRDGALGPSVAVSDKGSVAQADLFEDESGRLHAAWVRRGPGGDALRYRFSPDGTSFSEPFPLGSAGASEIWNVDLGAAGDGGGWAVWSSTLSGNGRISIAPFGTQARRVLIDARVTAIEVTQGIQTVELPRRSQTTSSINGVVRYSGVPLAADNWTFVRVYANLRRDVPGGATVPNLTLQAFRDGKPVGPPALPETRPPSLAAGALDEVTDAQRYTPANAYTFAVPWQTARGDVTFVAEINPAGLLPALDECRICRQDNALRLTGVRFQPVDRITVFPVQIDVGSVSPAGAPDLYGYFRRPGLETFTPLGIDFAGTTPVINAGGLLALPRLTQAQKEGALAQAAKDLAAAAGRGGNDVYPFGIFPNGQGAGNGLTVNGPLYSATPPVSIAADTRLLTSVGHEFHHGIGRVHAGLNCGGNANGQVGEAWPPGADGEMDGVALDTRGAPPYRIISNSSVPAPANPLYDLMSYCPSGAVDEARDWISVLNWTRAIAFNAPAARAATRRAVTRQAPARTLRFYTIVAPDAPAGGTFVTPDAGEATPVDPSSPYLLVARDAQGRDLATAGAIVEPVRTHSGNVEIVSGRVAAPGAASIVLLRDGQQVAAQTASANAPKVRMLSPARGARVGGRTVRLRWRATDADKDPLRVAIEYSQDGGARWTGIHSGPSAGKVALPARLFTASRKARVRVRVQDGFRETSATSARFVSRGAPPLVSIAAPAKGAKVAAGTSLALEGDAFDDRGAALEGKRLVWRDGRQRIGTGRRVLSRGLAPGRHVIVLQARDRRGRVSRASVTVRVTRAAPQLRVLKVPASLGRGARRVTLRVAATFPIRLRAGGKRYAIGTRPKPIRVKVKPGRSLLQLRLVLSAAGSRSSVTVLIPRR